MVILYSTLIVHILAASFGGTSGLTFTSEPKNPTTAFVGTNHTFAWNLSLETGEKFKKIDIKFGFWDSSHHTVTYYLGIVDRRPSKNETVFTNAKGHPVGSRLSWKGDLTHATFAAFRLINISISDAREYGIRLLVDGFPPDVYRKHFTLIVKERPSPTKRPEPKNATIDVQEGGQVNITCPSQLKSNSFVAWYRDGHFIQASEGNVLHVVNVNRSQAGNYSCNHTTAITTVHVLFAPTILWPEKQVVLSLFKGNSTILECYASANPPPTFTWHRDYEKISEGYNSTGHMSVLRLTVSSNKYFTRYDCTAKNTVGWDTATFVLNDAAAHNVSIKESKDDNDRRFDPRRINDSITIYLSAAAILAVFIIGSFLIHRYLTKACRRKVVPRAGEFAETRNSESFQMVDTDRNQDRVRFAVFNPAFNSGDLEIPRANLNIEKVIGHGAFGVVSRAFAMNLPDKPGWTLVAVKSIQDDASEKEKQDLLSEMWVLKQLDPHPHVIQLYGYVTTEERPLVVVEYAPHGDLLGYLRKSRGIRDNYYSDPSVKPLTSLTSKLLLKFIWEISDGMDYLSSKKIIHRDLAARNVLVGENEICKITDFGMARDVHEEDIYVRTTEGRLPVKWTAPEALFGSGSYTTASDVWSFGVVLYEVFTVGGDPFPGVYMRDIPALLHNGYRMPRPRFINKKLYNIMMDCWMDNPTDRPSFEQLRSIIGRLVEDQEQVGVGYIRILGNKRAKFLEVTRTSTKEGIVLYTIRHRNKYRICKPERDVVYECGTRQLLNEKVQTHVTELRDINMHVYTSTV